MYGRATDRIVDCSPAERRRLEYHALSELNCPGELTPHAVDDRLEVVSLADGELLAHLNDDAPAATDIDDPAYGDRADRAPHRRGDLEVRPIIGQPHI